MRSKDFGFTLIEVVISVMIMASGIMLVTMSWSSNTLRIRKARLNNNIATLLEKKLIEIEIEFKDKSIDQIPEEDSGDFGKDYPEYSWTLAAADFEMPDLSSVLISESDGADEMMLTIIKQTTEFINKSVKEVTVAVHVKLGKKKLSYPVTTYFVDYKQNFSLLGAAAAGGGSTDSSDSDNSDSGGSGSTTGGGTSP